MTLDDLANLPARLEAVERELRELKAANSAPALAFTPKEIHARFLPAIPEATIRAWIRSGRLPGHVTPGGTRLLVLFDDLQRFLQSLPGAADDDGLKPAASVSDATRRILSRQKTG